MGGPESRDKDSVTEVAGESFVRERPPEIERGTVLASRYQIEDIIGKGGSGIVLRVFDRVAQNVVALKVLKSELARDAKWEKRFSRELRLGRPIQHQNVCRIFDIGEAEGYRFLTMELASGGSLRDELKRKRSLERPIEERLADARAVIEGLAALHSAGVVHRDFKPDNILRMGDGRLVLSDFGLATDAANAAGATVMIGTPHYMAPEVLAGEPASSRSDVWALGVVLHEIFFGQRPERRSVSFDGSGRGPLRPSSSIERAMLRLCEICLADTPLDRPSDARAVAEIFDSRRPSRRAEAGRRKRLLTYGVALSLASVVAVTAGSRWRHRPSKGAGRGSANIIQLTPLGSTRDLSKVATTLAEVDGEISCLTVTGPRTARMVWGAAPRRAEDLDLTSGQRHPSVLASETYSLGCPDLSPSGKALLFASPTRAGAAEIRISDSPDGRDGTTVTAGSDPIWLGTDDEFLYQVDSAHVATFSRPTMTMSLLAAPTFGEHHVVIETAANRVGSAIAALLGSDRAEFAVTVYDGERFDSFRTFALPQGAHIQFADENDLYLTSFRLPGIASAVVTLDWKHGTFVDSAYYPGFDIRRATLAGNVELLTLRHVSSDAWSDGPHKRKLTSDGNNFSVATTRSGDLLLSKKDADGNFNIWRLGPNGRTQKLTSGKWDMGPDFAPDESSWAYADYSAKSIVVCTGNGEHCRVLRRDDMLPIWPRFSPDGRLLAYVTQVGAPKLRVISTKDATVSAVWDAYYQCPPIWSSTRTLWDLEMSGAKFSWYERNAITGARTGRQAPAPIESVETNEINCRPEALGDDLPPKPSAHIEVVETSRVVRTPRAAAQ